MKRLGSAETGVGVSMFRALVLLSTLRPAFAVGGERFVLMACGGAWELRRWLDGGGGRAKGFTGPVAPADRGFAFADVV